MPPVLNMPGLGIWQGCKYMQGLEIVLSMSELA